MESKRENGQADISVERIAVPYLFVEFLGRDGRAEEGIEFISVGRVDKSRVVQVGADVERDIS